MLIWQLPLLLENSLEGLAQRLPGVLSILGYAIGHTRDWAHSLQSNGKTVGHGRKPAAVSKCAKS